MGHSSFLSKHLPSQRHFFVNAIAVCGWLDLFGRMCGQWQWLLIQPTSCKPLHSLQDCAESVSNLAKASSVTNLESHGSSPHSRSLRTLPGWKNQSHHSKPPPGPPVVGPGARGNRFISAVRRRLKPLAEREGKTVEEYEQAGPVAARLRGDSFYQSVGW